MNAIKLLLMKLSTHSLCISKTYPDMDKVEFIADGVELSQNKAMGAPVTLLDLNSDYPAR